MRELLEIVQGDDDMIDEDDTIIERDPGYQKSDTDRRDDCERVRSILTMGVVGVDAAMRNAHGEPLLHLALEYDYGHAPQMLAVVLAAGADPNELSVVDDALVHPLESPWLTDDDTAVAALKRACLIRHGARGTARQPAELISAAASKLRGAEVRPAVLCYV